MRKYIYQKQAKYLAHLSRSLYALLALAHLSRMGATKPYKHRYFLNLKYWNNHGYLYYLHPSISFCLRSCTGSV